MPQEHHVLQCFSCETFQVHIVKKDRKWTCKMCGDKQSLKRNYGRGSAKDCRIQVMKLNERRALKGDFPKRQEDEQEPEGIFTEQPKEQHPLENKPLNSKWSEYVEETSTNGGSESDENTPTCLSEITNKKKRTKRMPKGSYSQKRLCQDMKTNSPVFDDSTDLSIDEIFDVKKSDPIQTPAKIATVKVTHKTHPVGAKTATVKAKCKTQPVNAKTETKQSKYAKYLDEDEESSNTTTQPSITSNIFNSDLADLDNILNF